MKIILPFLIGEGSHSIFSDRVGGGLERFARLLYDNVRGIIPVEFTPEDQKKRRVTRIVTEAVRANGADLVLSNYIAPSLTTSLQKQIDVPIALLLHAHGFFMASVQFVRMSDQFVDAGGSIFMVSKNQQASWNKVARRILGQDMPMSGFVSPSFSTGNGFITFTPPSFTADVCSIGRCDTTKTPFIVNEKLKGTSLTTSVITTKYKNDVNNKAYLESNLHWDGQFTTHWDLPHTDVLTKLASSRVFVSTCAEETWGITTFEALSHGVPTILLCKKGLEHASEDIAARSDHIIKLRKTCKQAEFVEAVTTLANYDEKKRKEIFNLTNWKHSKGNWLASIDRLIETSMANHTSRKVPTSLEDLMVD